MVVCAIAKILTGGELLCSQEICPSLLGQSLFLPNQYLPLYPNECSQTFTYIQIVNSVGKTTMVNPLDFNRELH
jgi:hypothetical protein